MAFIAKETVIADRVYHAWTAVFIIRRWSAWLEHFNLTDLDENQSQSSSNSQSAGNHKRNLFITMPALFSLELNAHSLTHLALLVAEGKMPEEALRVSLFDSQMCENTFRAARSMSGPFSSVVNFSVREFLQRAEKLAVLQRIKYSSGLNQNNLVFPQHHKQSRQINSTPWSLAMENTITQRSLEAIVSNAYLRAGEIVGGCDFSMNDHGGQTMSFDEVNHLAHRRLKRSKCKSSERKTSQGSHDEDEEEKEDEYDERQQNYDQSDEMEIPDDDEESTSNDETDPNVLPVVSRTTMNGMRIFDTIADDQSDSFFRVLINSQENTCISRLQIGTFRRLNQLCRLTG